MRMWLAIFLAGALAGQTPTLPPPAPPAARVTWPLPAEGGLRTAYHTPAMPKVNMQNSARLDQLVRDGKIYLSLQDAIALALENNLDLELERYTPRIAETDLLRAEAGGLLRGIPLSVREGPNGLGVPQPGPDGTLGGGNTPALSSLIGPGVQTDLSILGSLPLSTGPSIPSFDPAIVGQVSWAHRSDPQNNVFLPNLRSLNSNTGIANLGLQQGFSTGGFLDIGIDNTRQRINSPLLNYNPATTASLGVNFTQPLLRGFGFAVNKRYIRIAKNNRQVADYVFQQQVLTTVSGVVRLYWDLVSLNEDVRVRQEAVVSAEQFLRDNQNQVETGTAAPIDVTRARAELSRRHRDLAVSRTVVRQQEMILKDYLTRTRLDESLAGMPVVCTDKMSLPAQEPVEPVDDLVQRAIRNRPDLAQARLQLANSEISLKGSKSALLPALDLIGNVQNNALVGRPNNVSVGSALASNPLLGSGVAVDPIFLGNYGDTLGQLFSRNFPNYGVGVQLTVPLRNRAARADVVRDQLTVRQQEIRLQQLLKQVRLEVTNALLGVEQARASYEAARNERLLQEETVEAERERLDVGASTNYNVIQFQRDLAAARSSEVSAQASYMKAKTALQRAVGNILDEYGVVMDEAAQGTVSRESSLPAPSQP